MREAGDSRRAFDAAAGILLDAIDIIALVLDPSGRILLANHACEKLLGIPAEKMLGKSPFELGIAPRDPCPDEAAGEVEVKTPGGELRIVRWTSRVVFDADGSVRCVVATGADVTAASATERRLRESERRVRELAENVNDLVAELTLEGVFTYVNRRFEAALGFPPEQLVGHSCLDLIHSGDQELARETLAAFDRAGVSRRTTIRVRQRSGSYLAVESVARTFISPDGSLRLAVIARDVTERTAAETELRRVDRLVTLGTFAAGVAHEINNPVAAILLAAEVALERPRGKAGETHAAHTLERIADHARRCGAIVRSMLDFAAQGRSERRIHDVNDLVTRAIALVDGYARERGATLRFAPAADVPRIRANAVEIEQVLVNLLRNALESRTSATVEVETRLVDGLVQIAVSDDGEGIPLEARKQIFESFYSTKRATGGIGLGLAIVRRIITDHGGEIRLEDPPTTGTCFVVELPGVRASTWRTS
jgi:PAS domain S-box-containing protein